MRSVVWRSSPLDSSIHSIYISCIQCISYANIINIGRCHNVQCDVILFFMLFLHHSLLSISLAASRCITIYIVCQLDEHREKKRHEPHNLQLLLTMMFSLMASGYDENISSQIGSDSVLWREFNRVYLIEE